MSSSPFDRKKALEDAFDEADFEEEAEPQQATAEALSARIASGKWTMGRGDREAARLASIALAARPGKSERLGAARGREIVYFLSQAKKDGVLEKDIADALAMREVMVGLSQVEWSSRKGRAQEHFSEQEADDCVRAREEVFDWADALELPAGLFENALFVASGMGGVSYASLALCALAQSGPGSISALKTDLGLLKRMRKTPLSSMAEEGTRAEGRLAKMLWRAVVANIVGKSRREEARQAFSEFIEGEPTAWWTPSAEDTELVSRATLCPVEYDIVMFANASEDMVSALRALRAQWIGWTLDAPGALRKEEIRGLGTLCVDKPEPSPHALLALAQELRKRGVGLDGVGINGWSLLGWANNKVDPSSVGAAAKKQSEGWELLAKELLSMGASPWGLERKRAPESFAKSPAIATLARAARERHEIEQIARQAQRAGAISPAPNASGEAEPGRQRTSHEDEARNGSAGAKRL
jgi:alkylhydroperoxidase/carboxymuconolactone decarboxylase family protein YurZ